MKHFKSVSKLDNQVFDSISLIRQRLNDVVRIVAKLGLIVQEVDAI